MFGKRLTRIIVFATLIAAGVSFIALVMANFEMVAADTILAELLAIVILLVVIMGAALITAWGIRAISNLREKSREQDEDEDD